MDFLQRHKETLIPEFREVWAANGFKISGTWTEVLGPGKPDGVRIPVRTLSPPLTAEEHETGWWNLHWPVDEIFMAWHYARYVNKVAEAGKAEYNIPMFVNAWLQQRDHAWPGTCLIAIPICLGKVWAFSRESDARNGWLNPSSLRYLEPRARRAKGLNG